jgi:hypothetical protein
VSAIALHVPNILTIDTSSAPRPLRVSSEGFVSAGSGTPDDYEVNDSVSAV